MSHPYTDEFGWPLKTSEAARWMRRRGKPMYIDGVAVARPAPWPAVEPAADARYAEMSSKLVAAAKKRQTGRQ